MVRWNPHVGVELLDEIATRIDVEEEVMDEAGIIPEDNLESDAVLSATEREQIEAESDDPVAEERLSVFEDFLEGLDFSGGESEEDDSEDDS